MDDKEKWEEFVRVIRSEDGPRFKKFMQEVMADGLDNFLFIANSEEPDGPIIRGMHFPDSELLETAGPTVFETSEKNVYLAAYRKSDLVEILETIQGNMPEKYHEAIWEKTVEYLMAAAEEKINAGDVRSYF